MCDALNIVFVLATELEFRLATDVQEVFAVAVWTHRLDAMPIYNRRAMHPNKCLRIENPFQLLERR